MNPPTTPRTKLCGHDRARALVLLLGVALAACSSRSTHSVSEPDARAGGAGSGGASGAGSGGVSGGIGSGGIGAGGTAGPDASGGAAGAPSGMDCREFAEAHCSRFASCSPFLLQTAWGSRELCEAANQRACEGARDAPGSIPEGGGACLEAIRRQSCPALFGNDIAEECRFRGNLPLGAGCSYNPQCESGACQFDAPDLICGRCASPVAEGGDCTNDPCDYGLLCMNMRCVRPGTLGDACSVAQAPCNSVYRCENGACADPLPLGAACDAAAIPCSVVLGHQCLTDPAGFSSCTAMNVSPVNSPCGYVGGQISLCSGDAWCVQSSSECRPRPELGQSCEVSTTGPCAQPAHCVGGLCTADPPACTD